MEDEDESNSGSLSQSNVSVGSSRKDHHNSSTNKEGHKKTSESVMDYAKDTVNSFLKMYGYDDHVTTETILRSSIKSEPTTPTDDQPGRSSVPSDGMFQNEPEGGGVINKEDEQNRYSANDDPTPRTATVMPLQSSASTTVPPKRSSSVENSAKAPGTPRRPLTPYMRYRNMIFEEIKHKYPGCSPYDLACLISSKWSKLTDSERKVWEDQYEEDMKEYNETMQIHYSMPAAKRDWMQEKKTPAHLLSFVENINLRIEPQSPAQGKASTQESGKSNSVSQSGYCHWCKIRSYLQDFSTVIDGREIYCTGLCSEKCFNEAVKQICSVESGSSKPRYVKSTRPTSTYRDDAKYSSASSDSTVPSVQTSNQGFNWDQYLAETQATAAPWIYFKQSRNPPQNNFVVGMKLEASIREQYSSQLYSLATVVAVQGSRMMLHFDGADTSSDVWKLPDSGDIHPVGWTDGSKLRPPTGYKFDAAHYSNFFASSLHTADIGPARLFKKEPTVPMENYFSAGMKLEAVSRQKPSVIGVATVVNVDGEQLRIEFDGYKGVGYWCHYGSRDLFPAGWCARAEHPLQPPPDHRNDETSTSISSQARSTSPPHVSIETTNQASTALRNSISLATQRESVGSTSSWKDKLSLPNNVELFVNGDCFCGPYIEAQKFERLPRVYRGSIVSVLKNILEDTIKCATDPKTVFGFLKPGRGNCVITALCDGVTYQCCLNSVDRVSKFWTVLEQFSDNLRCCTNLFSSTDLRPCRRCSNNRSNHGIIQHAKRVNSQSYSQPVASSSRNRASSSGPPNLDYYKNVYRRDKAFETSSYSMVSYLSPRSGSGIVRSDSVFEHSRENSSGKGRDETNLNDNRYEEEENDVNVDGFEEPTNKKRKLEKKIAGGIEVTTAPKSWSIDDVTDFVVQTDLKDYIEKFKENEIDGKALLLLQRDLVLSHMGFKLGPAVKLLDLIEELKLIQEKFI